MAKYDYYSDDNVKTKLLKKRADDYARMVKVIDALGTDDSFSHYEFECLRNGHEKEYAAFSTLRDNDILVIAHSGWVNGCYRRSASQNHYSCRNIRFYKDNAGHIIPAKHYDTLCVIYGEKYVKDVLGFKFLEYRFYSPGHYETTYRVDETNAKKIRALEKTFRTICNEIL